MAMPNHLVLVRHAESEGNYIRNVVKKGRERDLARVATMIDDFRERPGSHWRITEKGEDQAKIAGQWIQEHIIKHNGLPGFDRYVYSPLRRTQETAGHLAIEGAHWRHDWRLRERSWGELENLTGEAEHAKHYPFNHAWMRRDPLHWTPPGGESIVLMADTRVRDVFDTWHRDHDEKGVDSVCAVTHGEWIWGAMLQLEYMTPDDWDSNKKNPALKTNNCQVVDYTRIDPQTGEQAPYLRWMRSVCPWKDDGPGVWREVERQTLTNQQMVAEAQQLPRMVPE